MKSVFSAILIMTIFCACTSSQDNFDGALVETDNSQKTSVIWDEDTRLDVNARDKTSPLAQATALFVRDFRLQKTPEGDFTFEARTLNSAYPICDGEKYTHQKILGHCSGVLVGPRQVLTAGHCVPSEKMCNESLIMFGHTRAKSRNLKVSGDEVYTCKRIVKIENNSTRDYAIIELDRDVTQAVPVKIGSGDALQKDETVLSLSYPLGLPLKKDSGAIYEVSNGGFYIRVKVDTFAGSSGSPLFNTKNELVGILSSGTDDFDEDEIHRIQVEKKPGDCLNFKRCTDNTCFGERYLKTEGIEFPQL